MQKRNWALSWLTELLGFALLIISVADLVVAVYAVISDAGILGELLFLELGLLCAAVGALLLYLGR